MKNKKNRSFLAGMLLGFFLGFMGLVIAYLLPKKEIKEAPAEGPSLDTVSIETTPPSPLVTYDEPALPMITNLWYFLTEENKQIGPMSFQKLKSSYWGKTLLDSNYVWNEGLENWTKLSDLPDYLDIIKD